MRPAEYRIQNTESGRPTTPSSLRQPSFQNPESNIHSCAISAPMHMHHMHMSLAEYRMQNTECARPCPPRPPQFPESRIQNPGGPHRPTPPTDSSIQNPGARTHTQPNRPQIPRSRFQGGLSPPQSPEPSTHPNRPQIPGSSIQNPGGPRGPRAEGRILVETEPDTEPEARGGEIESAALILYSGSPLIWEKPQYPGSAEQVLFPHPQPPLTNSSAKWQHGALIDMRCVNSV